MRDFEHREEVFKQLEELWSRYPDWRFMQMIVNMQAVFKGDMFYMEDDMFIEQIKEKIDLGF